MREPFLGIGRILWIFQFCGKWPFLILRLKSSVSASVSELAQFLSTWALILSPLLGSSSNRHLYVSSGIIVRLLSWCAGAGRDEV